MKEQINLINQSIKEKRDKLIDNVERRFASIVVPSGTQNTNNAKGDSVPPISYILYGVSALSACGAIASDSKLLCLGVAVASAFGGYQLSSSKKASKVTSATNSILNLDSLKNDISIKIIEAVKNSTNEWESFMEQKQKDVQTVIANSSLNDSQKDVMYSKVFVYEVIDISLSEFNSMMNLASNTADIKKCMDSYKSKLISAIDSVAIKQIAKYNSLFCD